MKNISFKLKHILLPLLIFTIVFILVYSFINWLFFIKFHITNWNEEITRFLIPALILLVFVPLFIWKKIAILRFADLKARVGFIIFTYFFALWPTEMAQNYLLSATSKLTQLSSLSQISEFPKTRYYTLKNCFVDNANAVTKITSKLSGKYSNKKLTYNLFTTLPIYDDSMNLVNKKAIAWLCVKYDTSLDNKCSLIEKDIAYKKLVELAVADFKTINFSNFIYLKMINNSNEKEDYVEVLQTVDSLLKPNTIFFKSYKEPYEIRNGNSLLWVFGALVISTFVMIFILICFKLNDSKPSSKWRDYF